MTPPTVSIISAGYLGQRLAKQLESEKYRVKVAFRSNPPKIQLNSVEYYFLNVEDGQLDYQSGLFDCDFLVICLPPGFKKGLGDKYALNIKALLDEGERQGVNRVIFTSSIGIYPEVGVFDEATDLSLPTDKAKALYQAEQKVLKCGAKYKQVLRLAGLFGDERHPGQFRIKLIPDNINLPVNMVHISDVVMAISALLKQTDVQSPIYNLVAPHHPTKGAFYRFAKLDRSQLMKLTGGSDEQGKWVDGRKICRELGFSYQYGNLFDALKGL